MSRVFRLFGPLSGGPEHRKIRNFAEASPKAASEEATSKESNLEEGNFEGTGLGYHVLVCNCCISVGWWRARNRKILNLEHTPLSSESSDFWGRPSRGNVKLLPPTEFASKGNAYGSWFS